MILFSPEVNAHVLIVLGILVTLENVAVLVVFALHRKLHVLAHAPLISLIVADLCFAVSCVAAMLLLPAPEVSIPVASEGLWVPG